MINTKKKQYYWWKMPLYLNHGAWAQQKPTLQDKPGKLHTLISAETQRRCIVD
jgi:hypothetical protein